MYSNPSCYHLLLIDNQDFFVLCKCYFYSNYLHPFVTAELKSALSNFIEQKTMLDYDREAEQALQRLTAGDVDVNQLTDAWARSYVEVMHECIFVSGNTFPCL